MTTALSPLARVPKLARVAAQYVKAVPAPEPVSILLLPSQNQIDIQPESTWDPVNTVAALLIWAHKLTGITGGWWHTPGGYLHITLTGRGPYGVGMRIYSGFPYARAAHLLNLAPDTTESVTPDELYRLALEIRASKENPS